MPVLVYHFLPANPAPQPMFGRELFSANFRGIKQAQSYLRGQKPDEVSPPPPSGTQWTTTFPAVENPLSQGNIWTEGGRDGIDWQNVQSVVGEAYGTGNNPAGQFNDNIAALQAFGISNTADQFVEITFVLSPGFLAGCECEALILFTIAPHSAMGYEIDCVVNAAGVITPQIVRWNGPLANFSTTVVTAVSGSMPTFQSSDLMRVEAKIISGVPTFFVYRNGGATALATFQDITIGKIISGFPGMGFFNRGTPQQLPLFGISRWSGGNLNVAPPPPSPDVSQLVGDFNFTQGIPQITNLAPQYITNFDPLLHRTDFTAGTPPTGVVMAQDGRIGDDGIGPAGSAGGMQFTVSILGYSLVAMPTVPGNAKNLFTTFGISPSTSIDQQTVLQNALNSLSAGDFLVFPPGTYRHSGPLTLTVPGVTLWSDQAEPAILHSLAPSGGQAAVALQANGVGVYGFTLHAETTTRQFGTLDAAIAIFANLGGPRVDNCVVRRCRIEQSATTPNGSCAVGIIAHHASNYLIAENYVSRTLADGIHSTQGSFNGRVIGNTVKETGDDMIACVSYASPIGTAAATISANLTALRADRLVHNIYIAWNNVSGNYNGRGISVVGGEDMTIEHNTISKTCQAASVITAREPSFLSFGVNNIIVRNNDCFDCQTTTPVYTVGSFPTTGHASLELNALVTSDEIVFPNLVTAYEVKNVLMSNNTITRAAFTGIRVNPRGSTDSRLGLLGFINTTMATITGAAISVLNTPTPSFNVYTSGNTDDGAPASFAGSTPPAPTVTGYT